jgi:large subunit ribosomal protein L4
MSVKTNLTGAKVITAKDLALTEGRKRSVSKTGFSICIRALLQNWRQGTVAVKGRSDVSYSNKKPWRQKGTGRARAGSARSPLWRGGGVCHGPQPRVRMLKVSKDLKHSVLNRLLWDYLDQGKIICIDNGFQEKPKTAVAYKMLKDAGLERAKVNLLVRPEDRLTQASFANIAGVKTFYFDQANAFDFAGAHALVVLKKDLDVFKDMVSKWL